jgi:hypothetical protein
LKAGESLYGNYHAYLCDARRRIRECTAACLNWTYPYDGENPPHDALTAKKENRICDSHQSCCREEDINTREMVKNDGIKAVIKESVPDKDEPKRMSIRMEQTGGCSTITVSSMGIVGKRSVEDAERAGLEDAEKSVDAMSAIKEGESDSNSVDVDNNNTSSSDIANVSSNYHSLPSIGESSGYESFALKGSSESTPENEPCDDRQTDCDLVVMTDTRTEIGESKSKENDSVSDLRNASRESSPRESVHNTRTDLSDVNVRHCRAESGSSIYSRTEDFSNSRSELWPFSRKFSREGSYVDIFNTTPDIGM